MAHRSPIISLAATAAALALAASVRPASAGVLLLDFGPTAATGASLTNSPYHADAPSFTGTTWNQLANTDPAAGSLLWSDGTAAPALTLDLGSNSNYTANTTLDLATPPGSTNALGSTINTGVYAGTSVAKDGIYTGSTGHHTAVGLQITGLAAGTYDVYVMARNTNTGNGQAIDAYAGSSAAGNFDYATLAESTLTAPGKTDGIDTWQAGVNYVKLTVALNAGDALNVVTQGDPDSSLGDHRGFMNAVEIAGTPVPEPASLALLALAGAGLLLRRRKA